MADQKEMNLALFLDRSAGSLADDLEWALAQLDNLKQHIPTNIDNAERYIKARGNLRSRRMYEESCARQE